MIFDCLYWFLVWYLSNIWWILFW